MSFLEIFQPGLKHLREERDRQRMLVVRPSHGGGPPLGIDLNAGTASIVVRVQRGRRRDRRRGGALSQSLCPPGQAPPGRRT